jgi:isoaspartyl peptidase/L-asparaginase-like protein (Ntn-hydrolase superfamily)
VLSDRTARSLSAKSTRAGSRAAIICSAVVRRVQVLAMMVSALVAATTSCRTVDNSEVWWAGSGTGSSSSCALSIESERPGCTMPIVQPTLG